MGEVVCRFLGNKLGRKVDRGYRADRVGNGDTPDGCWRLRPLAFPVSWRTAGSSRPLSGVRSEGALRRQPGGPRSDVPPVPGTVDLARDAANVGGAGSLQIGLRAQASMAIVVGHTPSSRVKTLGSDVANVPNDTRVERIPYGLPEGRGPPM